MTDLPVPAGEASLSFGSSNLQAGDLVPPRVKLVQAQSDEVANKLAVAGEFFNTLTSENMGTKLTFIPLLPFMNRILLVREERREAIDGRLAAEGLQPLNPATKGLACRSLDMYQGRGEPGILCTACPLSQWGEANTPPLCSETWNIAAMTDLGELIILSFGRSSAKVGKRLFSMLRLTRQAPWSAIYTATSRQEKGERGTFFVPEITKSKEVPGPELLRWAEDWAKQLGSAGPIDVTPESADVVEEGAF